MKAAGLTSSARPRQSEARSDGHGHARHGAVDDLELVPLAHGHLVDVAGKDELRSRVHEPGQDGVPACDGLLAGAPGGADQVMVEDDDAESSGRSRLEECPRAVELGAADPARLMAPGPRRVEPDDLERFGLEERLGRLPDALELLEGPGQAPPRPGDVVVTGNDEQGPPERAQKARGILVLATLRTMREVSARDDQLGPHMLDEGFQAEVDSCVVTSSEMQVGNVENPGGHDRGRL